MMEGLRVWFNEGIPVGSGRLGRRAIFQTVRLVRPPLFCVIGIVCFRLAFSAAAELAPTNLGTAVTNPVLGGGTTTGIATKPQVNDQSPLETQTLANTTNTAATFTQMEPEKMNRQISELNPSPTPSIGMEIVGGVALFIWVWRFRNSPV